MAVHTQPSSELKLSNMCRPGAEFRTNQIILLTQGLDMSVAQLCPLFTDDSPVKPTRPICYCVMCRLPHDLHDKKLLTFWYSPF